MVVFLRLVFTISILFLFSCKNGRAPGKESYRITEAGNKKNKMSANDTVYRSPNLMLVKLSEGTYQHISYLNTDDFGKVACNGMVAFDNKEAVVFDSPADLESTDELIKCLTDLLQLKIIAVIPTHFHKDCVGGIKSFQSHQVFSYASNKTIALLKTAGDSSAVFLKGFDDSFNLKVGSKEAMVRYFGAGHTNDNVVGYFPADSVLFGGCLIKEMDATKGFLGDANLAAWSATVQKVKRQFPNTKIVIPGHGFSGGKELLDYTEALFK